MAALAGLVPWAPSGIKTTVRGLSQVAEIGRRDQQRGELAVGPGRRLQRDRLQAGDLGQHLLRPVEQLQQPLQRPLRLIGVQARHAGQAGQPLVPLGIVLHRAGAQRIEVRIDRHVERREVDEVAHHFRLGAVPAAAAARRPAPRGGSSSSTGRSRHVGLGEPDRPAAGLGKFKQQSGRRVFA